MIKKERLIGALTYGVIGTVIVWIVEQFQGLEFQIWRMLLSFVLISSFGYFIFKKSDQSN